MQQLLAPMIEDELLRGVDQLVGRDLDPLDLGDAPSEVASETASQTQGSKDVGVAAKKATAARHALSSRRS